MTGYAELKLMVSSPELAILRRFGVRMPKHLLSLASELLYLEERLMSLIADINANADEERKIMEEVWKKVQAYRETIGV